LIYDYHKGTFLWGGKAIKGYICSETKMTFPSLSESSREIPEVSRGEEDLELIASSTKIGPSEEEGSSSSSLTSSTSFRGSNLF
jgi:hypothetical protein